MAFHRRALIAAFLVAALALEAAPIPARAAERAAPSSEQLRVERAALLQEIAALADRVEHRHAEFVVAQERRSLADAEARAARRRLQEHAVEAYIHSHELAGARRARNGIFAAAIAEADRDVITDLDRALRATQVEEDAAERALAGARATENELAEARTRLEATLADVEATEEQTRLNAEARRLALLARPAPPMPVGATRRHRESSARQVELMARWPFGPIAPTALPDGLTRTGEVVEGMASWYGPGFDGRATASGAIYDQEGWTVASKELPLGTMLLITRGDRSVLALVNDRGPYVAGRVLDLSHGVAVMLDTVRPGVAWVRAEVVVPAS